MGVCRMVLAVVVVLFAVMPFAHGMLVPTSTSQSDVIVRILNPEQAPSEAEKQKLVGVAEPPMTVATAQPIEPAPYQPPQVEAAPPPPPQVEPVPQFEQPLQPAEQKPIFGSYVTTASPKLGGSTVEKTVVFAGLVRDAEPTLPSLLRDLTDAACLFKDASLVILESNSRDATPQILQDFARANHQNCKTSGRMMAAPFREIQIIHAKPPPNDERIRRLVYYRNELRTHLMRRGNVDYVFMMDMDISSFDVQTFQKYLPSYINGGLGAVCLNDHYRDTFATVATNKAWAFQEDRRLHHNSVIPLWNAEIDVENEVRRQGGLRHGALEVDSCFNAATLYSASHYFNSACTYKTTADAIAEDSMFEEYTSGMDDRQMCEHVYLHTCLKRRSGFRIGISLFPDYVQHYVPHFASVLVQKSPSLSTETAKAEELLPSSLQTMLKWSA